MFAVAKFAPKEPMIFVSLIIVAIPRYKKIPNSIIKRISRKIKIPRKKDVRIIAKNRD